MEIPLGNRKLNITCGNKNQVELKKRKYNWNLNFVEYLLAADFENRIKNDLKDQMTLAISRKKNGIYKI